MSNNLPSVAVVILCWNGRFFLEKFIPSLLKTSYKNVVFFVADNSSTDGSVAFIKDKFPELFIINIEKNEGFAKGYNIALQQINADYYVLLNQDVEVTPNWLEPIIELSESNANIAAIQPKIKAYHSKEYFEYGGAAGGYIDWLGYAFCKGRLFDNTEEDQGQYNVPSDIFWASGAALFIKAKIYHQMGGLDNDFFAHMEEIDLCWRIHNAGYKIMYCPNSTVYHVGGGSLPYGNPKKTYLNYRNNLIMMLKNNQETFFALIFLLRLILDGISAVSLLLKGKWRDVHAIFMAHTYVYLNFKDILIKRKKSQSLFVKKNNNDVVYNKSIVWNYFVLGKKKFTELKF